MCGLEYPGLRPSWKTTWLWLSKNQPTSAIAISASICCGRSASITLVGQKDAGCAAASTVAGNSSAHYGSAKTLNRTVEILRADVIFTSRWPSAPASR